MDKTVMGMEEANKLGIHEFLEAHHAVGGVSFHMPGHKGSRFFTALGYSSSNIFKADYDITEITGADNLFQPETIIRRTMDKYRRLYHSRESYLLVNGSSCGLIASVLATVLKGGKILVARNSHKSIFNAILLGGLTSVYVYPERCKEYPIGGGVTPEAIEKALIENPDISAVVIPSPNYYGIMSDIKAIAELAHSHGAILIVDQAHGAHLNFYSPDYAAENLGADIVVVSIHKTLAGFTQTAILNVYGENVDLNKIERNLHMLETTSPSYLLMASLDVNADIMMDMGEDLMKAWHHNIDKFYAEALWIKGIMTMLEKNFDETKINLDATFLGLSGDELGEELEKRGVFPELTDERICMCMTGIGNVRSDYVKLLDALRDISNEHIDDALLRYEKAELESSREREKKSIWMKAALVAMEKGDKQALDEIEGQLQALADLEEAKTGCENDVAVSMERPWGAITEPIKFPERDEEAVALQASIGRIATACITPYPPGIPTICPGEVISKDVANEISHLKAKGNTVTGLTRDGRITVEKKVLEHNK